MTMRLTYENIRLGEAKKAIRAYNGSLYRGICSTDVDRQAAELFAHGLAVNREGIAEQVRFIGKEYGGVAGFPAALRLVDSIADHIHRERAMFHAAASSAQSAHPQPVDCRTLEVLYAPFRQRYHGKNNWLVWASKFWHFIGYDAFPIIDTRVDRFFRLSWRRDPIDRYKRLLRRFHCFVNSRESWLESLIQSDRQRACCATKLWDKVFYGVRELELDCRLTAST